MCQDFAVHSTQKKRQAQTKFGFKPQRPPTIFSRIGILVEQFNVSRNKAICKRFNRPPEYRAHANRVLIQTECSYKQSAHTNRVFIQTHYSYGVLIQREYLYSAEFG